MIKYALVNKKVVKYSKYETKNLFEFTRYDINIYVNIFLMNNEKHGNS